jgi:hypothetical protein
VTVWVLVEAADGPVFVPHTEDELERLVTGVDVEASWAATAPLDNNNEFS